MTSDPESMRLLCQEILDWTRGSLLEEIQKPVPEKYVLQKAFVILFHLGRIASKYDLDELRGESTFLAAQSIAQLDIERLCVFDAMMLSVFINNNSFPDMNDTSVFTIIQLQQVRQVIEAKWDGFVPEDSRYRAAITGYMMDIITPSAQNWVPPHDPTESSLTKVHLGIIQGVIDFVESARSVGMRSENWSQLLGWATRVWDWFFHLSQSPKRDKIRAKFRGDMEGLIRSIRIEEAGPSSQN
jgi:hypothetical protein